MEWDVDITAGMKERTRRLYLFEPLNELANKRQFDANNKQIDMRMLGLYTLLFFFEMKLMREQRIGMKEVGVFLSKPLQQMYELTDEKMEELLIIVKETFRPAKGVHKSYVVENWETNELEEFNFSFIKTDYFDVKKNRQYYQLDDDGLELIFATKEYFQEFQLSIHQLMLRKLLEKGELQGALRQINEMRMDVEQLHERMEKLSLEIKRNIINMETQQRFMDILKDRNQRLNRENTEFEELLTFIVEMKQDTESTENDIDIKAFRMLGKIDSALIFVHEKHKDLLTHSLKLKEEALDAAEQSLYSIGVDNFNFDQEIVGEIIATPLPVESMKGVLAPFLKVEQHKSWSLLTIFAAQSWSEEDQQAEAAYYGKLKEEETKEKYAKFMRSLYGRYMQAMLDFAQSKTKWSLKEWFEVITEQKTMSLDERSFYDFLLLCHQRAPLEKSTKIEDELSMHLLAEAVLLLGKRKLIIEEQKEILQVTTRFSIQNLSFRWEGA